MHLSRVNPKLPETKAKLVFFNNDVTYYNLIIRELK